MTMTRYLTTSFPPPDSSLTKSIRGRSRSIASSGSNVFKIA